MLKSTSENNLNLNVLDLNSEKEVRESVESIFNQSSRVQHLNLALNYDCKMAKEFLRLVFSFSQIVFPKTTTDQICLLLELEGSVLFASIPLANFRGQPWRKLRTEAARKHSNLS